MAGNARFLAVIFLGGIMALCLYGCAGEQKKAELEVADSEFSIRKEAEYMYVVDAKGVIRNLGPADVKRVEVTGYCRSCREEIIDSQWYISDYEKMEHQKDVISYLSAGSKSDFDFTEVAFYSANRSKKAPEKLPEDLEISIESYEVVQ
ncbi:MAG: hypothetical protein KGY42_08520 [Desulfobacterales bacterium]|nr:hypothetical protein [Desulfobacterales bacterium]MBS3754168.1 hypothetical protein [Desulfobacterales bacterium]